MKTYHFNYRGGEIVAEVEAQNETEAYKKILNARAGLQVNASFLHNDFWELNEIIPIKKIKQKEYKIFIDATILSTLTPKEIKRQLVASLYDIDTLEKISDGDSIKFEVLDYIATDVMPFED